MFLGEFVHSLDSKARLMLPAKYREELSPSLVIARNPTEPCLRIWTMAKWTAFADELDKRSMIDPNVALFRRILFSAAEDIKPDAQGRILVSPRLREYARLEEEVVIAGMYTYLELWNPTLWQEKVLNRIGDVNEQLFSALNL